MRNVTIVHSPPLGLFLRNGFLFIFQNKVLSGSAWYKSGTSQAILFFSPTKHYIWLVPANSVFSLSPNQHKPPTIGQSVIFFSHNKSAPSTNYSQPDLNINAY